MSSSWSRPTPSTRCRKRRSTRWPTMARSAATPSPAPTTTHVRFSAISTRWGSGTTTSSRCSRRKACRSSRTRTPSWPRVCAPSSTRSRREPAQVSEATEAAAADSAARKPAARRRAPTPAAVAPKHSEYGASRTNPLRDPADRRLPRGPEPCALVIFGIGGDLSRKKLIPAVYDLANRGLLPTDFVVLGFSRADWPGGGSFEKLTRNAAKEHCRTAWNEEVWRRLSNNTRFVEGSFDDDASFDKLVETMQDLRDSHGIRGNAAFYLSVPPSMFPVVLKQMQRTGLSDSEQAGGWRRVVVEKPFGHDLPSALELNRLVDTVFPARDVYRIDHSLGKETVQNLLALRFANQLFEPVWNANFVDS